MMNKTITINGKQFNLLDQELAQPGDLCVEYETGEVFLCRENKSEEDYFVAHNFATIYTNVDPFQVYKVEL